MRGASAAATTAAPRSAPSRPSRPREVIPYTLREYSTTGGRREGARSGNRDGWLGVVGRGRREGGRRVLADLAGGRGGVTHPFWRAILSPCLITVRSTSRARGWARSCQYFCQ